MKHNQKVCMATYQKEKTGNDFCGDSYFFSEEDHGFICVIDDGLGSGEIAGESSQAVEDIIKNNVDISDEALVKKCVQKLSGKRGSVLGVLRLDYENQLYTYSYIGNVNLVITMESKQRKRTIPRPGFLGNYERKLKVIEGDLKEEMGFIMFSDGVTDQDLTKLCLFDENVDRMIETFAHSIDEVRKDDTTLIVMKYNL